MFTGIIEEVGRVQRLAVTAVGGTLSIAAATVLDELDIGDSIAVNGVCLTVTTRDKFSFTADMSGETLRRSALGKLTSGMLVNLERSLKASARLGGHLVQGHVDATGTLVSKQPAGESWTVRFCYPEEIARYLAVKGSVAVDGISLTVAGLGDDWFEAAVIPHTMKMTNLKALKSGDPVNLEVDILAKYVERMLLATHTEAKPPASSLTVEYLKELGY
jgi:riboflavin synthase